MTPLRQKLLAELLGTFALVFAAVGSAAAGEGLLGQAFANGLVLSVLVAAYAGVSGAHFNPAVTVAFATVGRCAWSDVAPYLATQMVAATLAAWAVLVLHGGGSAIDGGAALPASPEPSIPIVFGGEVLITFLLMVAIYGTMIDRRGADGGGGGAKIGAFGVGFAVAANILALGPVTGGSMNPARSFGPALVRGDFQLHWIYWAGPLLGALAGAWLYETQMLRETPVLRKSPVLHETPVLAGGPASEDHAIDDDAAEDPP